MKLVLEALHHNIPVAYSTPAIFSHVKYILHNKTDDFYARQC